MIANTGSDGGVAFVHCCDEKLDAHTGHVISMGRFAFVVYKNRRNEFATDFAVVHIKVASGDSDNEEWPVVIVESTCAVPDENNFGVVVKGSEIVDVFYCFLKETSGGEHTTSVVCTFRVFCRVCGQDTALVHVRVAIAEPVRRRHHFTFSELVVEVQHLDDGAGCDSEGAGFMPLARSASITDAI